MRKKFYLKIFTLIFILILVSKGILASDNAINIFIEGQYKQESGALSEIAKINVEKKENETFKDILDKHKELKTQFDDVYKADRKLISESSTVKQAYEHSRQMLDDCMKFEDEYSDLKEHAILQLLVGEWDGTLNIDLKDKTDKYEFSANRKFEVSFESNQAGQISKGIVKGIEILKKKDIVIEEANKESLNEDINADALELNLEETFERKSKEVSGSIVGNIIPQADSILDISLDNNTVNSEVPKKYNVLHINAKTFVEMEPIVKQEVIDEAFSLNVSHMKIYYNLLSKTRRPVEKVLQDNFDLFFNDILYLLKISSDNVISPEVYKPLGIYPKSEFVTQAFEDYVITLGSYYNKVFLKSESKKSKLESYKVFLIELIQIASICHMGIVEPAVIKRLNLDINDKRNLINKVFTRYYDIGKQYYTDELNSSKNSENKKDIKKEYLKFMKEVLAVTETGLIHKETIKELNIKPSIIQTINDM